MKHILRHPTGLGLVLLILFFIAPGSVLGQAPTKICFHTVASVSQVWSYVSEESLNMLPYTREYSPCKPC